MAYKERFGLRRSSPSSLRDHRGTMRRGSGGEGDVPTTFVVNDVTTTSRMGRSTVKASDKSSVADGVLCWGAGRQKRATAEQMAISTPPVNVALRGSSAHPRS